MALIFLACEALSFSIVMILAINTPIPTATTKSTKTVRFADEKDNEKYPTVAEKTWARAVLYNANNEAIKAFNFILARNKDLEDLSVLNSYTNDQIQSEVNRVTRYLVLAQAGQ